MKVERETFLADLEMVKAGLSPREFVEQSSCFVFQNGRVMTFNDEVACRKDVGIQFTGAIQAASLLDILSRLTDDELLVEENEKGELEFRGKRKAFGIIRDSEIFLPIDKVESPEKWKPLPAKFAEAVDLVHHCVSTDESRFLLTCIHLNPGFIEACDNFQIMRVKLEWDLKHPVLVRGSSIVQVVSLGMDHYSLTKNWVHFKNPSGLEFSCRRFKEDFPSLDKEIVVEGHDITIPKGVKDAAERAAVFATNKSGDPLVDVTLTPGRIEILGEGLTGWYKERKKVAYEGPGLRFMIAPELLKYISENYRQAVIKPGKLKAQGGSWEYISVLSEPNEAAAEEDDEKPVKKKKKPSKDES